MAYCLQRHLPAFIPVSLSQITCFGSPNTLKCVSKAFVISLLDLFAKKYVVVNLLNKHVARSIVVNPSFDLGKLTIRSKLRRQQQQKQQRRQEKSSLQTNNSSSKENHYQQQFANQQQQQQGESPSTAVCKPTTAAARRNTNNSSNNNNHWQ